MTQHHRKRSRAKRSEHRPVVSAFSILILAGFLIGSAASRFVTGDLRDHAMLAGVFGILAFVGLDQVKHRRKRRADAADQMYLEGRLERHVDHFTSAFEDDDSDSEDIEEVEVSAEELQAAC